MDIVDEILNLFETRGSAAYLGEPVSQREHALQAAHLAALDGAAPPLVAAALLHDLGHLLNPAVGEASAQSDWASEDNPAEHGIDARHEDLAHAWLSRHFGQVVAEPVRLHVLAKRYLCAVEPEYLKSLSPASILSLELQGGPLTAVEVEIFDRNPFAHDAVRLRRWDDLAKVPEMDVPDVAHYAPVLRKCLSEAQHQ